MTYNLDYNPRAWRTFKDNSHMKNFVNSMLRTDVTRRSEGPLTPLNLYFIRKDGELQHFQNVNSFSQRKELKGIVLDLCQSLPLEALRTDRVLVSPYPNGSERTESFQDIAEEELPRLWQGNCPFPGQEDRFLDATIAIVMHMDESFDGESLQCNIHRIYVNNFQLLSK